MQRFHSDAIKGGYAPPAIQGDNTLDHSGTRERQAPDRPSPQFICRQGARWWADDATTQYAASAGRVGLAGVAAFIVQSPDGLCTHVLVRKGAVIATTQHSAALVSKIDALRRAESVV